MKSKQLINQLCYEYSTKNYNEEKLKATHEIKKNLDLLEEYRKIEEELGIDLITLFNIISGKQKIYIEEELFKNSIRGEYWKDVKCFICKSFDYNFIYCDCWDEENFQGRTHTEVISIKEYGKTWFLDRKDLENEQL